jgi:hypothetical protein
MTQQTITPPFDLVQQWDREWRAQQSAPVIGWSANPVIGWSANLLAYVASRAALWGADQELEACCKWFQEFYKTETWVDLDLKTFRAARRPKPPSLKEQALETLKYPKDFWSEAEVDTIRRALESIND